MQPVVSLETSVKFYINNNVISQKTEIIIYLNLELQNLELELPLHDVSSVKGM
jgi:hypothetical protein